MNGVFQMIKTNIDVENDDPVFNNLIRQGANIIIEFNGKKITVPKVLNGHRGQNEKTITELKEMKLMPIAEPIGYGLQQFNGAIFYLYDIDKTKKFKLTDNERRELKKYREDLKSRKRCPICGIVQRSINDIKNIYIGSGEKYLSCYDCLKLKEEQTKQLSRDIKHDYTSYFINKGIVLSNSIDETKSYDIVYLDFETTGLSSIYDEIIQVSIIDSEERVLLYKLCKPLNNKTWDEAMNINSITPKDVENELPFENYINDISSILERTKTIVCYNCSFEIGFLNKYGVTFSINKFQDCMLMFAKIYGEWSDYFEDYKWQQLTTATEYYNYNFEGQEHNSLADVFATKFVFEKILAKP